MTESYYDEIPCPFRRDCAIQHTVVNKTKWKAMQGQPIGERLLRLGTIAVGPAYYLYLAPYGCFGDSQAASNCGEVIVTTKPHKYLPVVFVEMEFLNRVPHVLIDEI